MSFTLWGCKIVLNPLFFVVITLLLLLDRTGQVPYVLCAVVIHEIGHLVIMKLLHVMPQQIKLNPFEINIVRRHRPLGNGGELLISSAGVAANGLVTLIAWAGSMWVPHTVWQLLIGSNIGVALFNLMPVSSLDGWQILLCLLRPLGLGKNGEKLISVLSWLFIVALFCLSIPMLFIENNPTLLLFCIYVGILQPMRGKS